MSKRALTIVVLAGGVSAEREVSLASGRASALALARSFPTRLVEVSEAALPHGGQGIDPLREVVFSTLHGVFGEDGQMQQLLDEAGIHYAGCGAAASALAMDKQRTKDAAAAVGVASPRGLCFAAASAAQLSASELVARFGSRLVLKPNAEGSSVGLRLIEGEGELRDALASVGAAHASGELLSNTAHPKKRSATWLLEERVLGRELSVGVLEGNGALGIVEIWPKSGVYDYTSKYTAGHTEYLAPAPLEEAVAVRVREAAERVCVACGVRDYARVDFILSARGDLYLLEINTLPGMKATSLLPMSARCAGLDFAALLRALVAPAVQRFLTACAKPRPPQ